VVDKDGEDEDALLTNHKESDIHYSSKTKSKSRKNLQKHNEGAI